MKDNMKIKRVALANERIDIKENFVDNIKSSIKNEEVFSRDEESGTTEKRRRKTGSRSRGMRFGNKKPTKMTMKCSYCPKMFAIRNPLYAHEHMHLNIRPYRCSFCSKTFTHQSNLNCI